MYRHFERTSKSIWSLRCVVAVVVSSCVRTKRIIPHMSGIKTVAIDVNDHPWQSWRGVASFPACEQLNIEPNEIRCLSQRRRRRCRRCSLCWRACERPSCVCLPSHQINIVSAPLRYPKLRNVANSGSFTIQYACTRRRSARWG